MRKLKITFKCLTPIFIGSGEQLDYLDIYHFPYREKDSSEVKIGLYKIYPQNVPSEMSEQFSQFIEEKKTFLIPKTYSEYRKKYSLERTFLGRVSPDIMNKIQEIEKGKLDNQVCVNLFVAGRKGIYIPGSSIKGALKTPYIKKNRRYYKDDGSAQKIEGDPFAKFSVRDSCGHNFHCRVGNIEVKNFPRDGNRRNTNDIPSYCQYLTPGSGFECEIMDCLETSYNFEETHGFYRDAFDKMNQQVYGRDENLDGGFAIAVNKIDPSKKEFLISLGGFGGVWTKKCLGNDRFYRPQDGREVNEKSSFRKNFDFRMPMGWCKGRWESL